MSSKKAEQQQAKLNNKIPITMQNTPIFEIFSFGRRGYQFFHAFLPNLTLEKVNDRTARKYLIIDLDFWKQTILREKSDKDPVEVYSHLLDRDIVADRDLYEKSSNRVDVEIWMDKEWFEFFTSVRISIFKKYGL